MDNCIRLNFTKYILAEILFIVLFAAFLYWLSGGIGEDWTIYVVLLLATTLIVKTSILWTKLSNSSLLISNGNVFFNGFVCEVSLLRSFLPFGFWASLKISYMVEPMQKRSIYIPKEAMNEKDWVRILVCRTY